MSKFEKTTESFDLVSEGTPEVMSLEQDRNLIESLTERRVTFCSLHPETREEKIAMFNAMNNPSKRLADCINETISMKDLFVEIVELTNDYGDTEACPRIVIIDEDGMSYTCVSFGIFNSLRKFIELFGAPTWEDPIKVKILSKQKDKKSLLTMEAI